MDFDRMLEDGSPPETGVPICMNGKLRRQYEEVKARVEAHETSGDADEADTRLGGVPSGPAVDEDRALLDDLRAQMREWTQVFTVRAMDEQDFRRLVEQHPPRTKDGKNDPRDYDGVNSETYYPALVKASIAEPEMTDERWAKLVKKLTPGQRAKLSDAAVLVNGREEDIPF